MDDATRGMLDCWLQLDRLIDDGYMRAADGAVVGVTGLPLPTLNGVWAPMPPPADKLDALLDEVAEAGVPYCLQLPSAPPADVIAMVEQRGMTRDEDIPLMQLADASGLAVPVLDGLTVRRLGADEVDVHAAVAAGGFGAPVEIFERLIGPAFAGDQCAVVAVAEVDGDPVTTGVSLQVDGRVGIFNVATPPEHRGRGYGAAITAWLVADAASRGARSAWLQSSPDGYGIYQRLGFRTVDRWQCWLALP